MDYKYRCCRCGKVFNEPGYYQDLVGEFWGQPAYEAISCCPYCGYDYEEVEDADDVEEDT